MEGILSFFEGFSNAITTVIDFVISFFKDTVYMISLLVKSVASFPTYFTWLPGPVVALLLTLVGIVVIYKILGREG